MQVAEQVETGRELFLLWLLAEMAVELMHLPQVQMVMLVLRTQVAVLQAAQVLR
jgi:hypothetical protein